MTEDEFNVERRKPYVMALDRFVGEVSTEVKNIKDILKSGEHKFDEHSKKQDAIFQAQDTRLNCIERKLDRSLEQCPYVNTIEKNINNIKQNAENISWVKGHMLYFYLAFLGLAGWIGWLCKKVFDYHSK